MAAHGRRRPRPTKETAHASQALGHPGGDPRSRRRGDIRVGVHGDSRGAELGSEDDYAVPTTTTSTTEIVTTVGSIVEDDDCDEAECAEDDETTSTVATLVTSTSEVDDAADGTTDDEDEADDNDCDDDCEHQGVDDDVDGEPTTVPGAIDPTTTAPGTTAVGGGVCEADGENNDGDHDDSDDGHVDDGDDGQVDDQNDGDADENDDGDLQEGDSDDSEGDGSEAASSPTPMTPATRMTTIRASSPIPLTTRAATQKDPTADRERVLASASSEQRRATVGACLSSTVVAVMNVLRAVTTRRGSRSPQRVPAPAGVRGEASRCPRDRGCRERNHDAGRCRDRRLSPVRGGDRSLDLRDCTTRRGRSPPPGRARTASTLGLSPTHRSTRPGEAVLIADEHALVRTRFEQLPERDRELLELRFVVGLSTEEVAEALGRRPGRSALHSRGPSSACGS